MKQKLLSLVVAAALAAGAAQAQEPAKVSTGQQQATRAEIDRLVERIEVLSKQLGEDADVRVIVRRGDHGAPRALDERDLQFKVEGPEGSDRREFQIERTPGHDGDFRSRPGLGIVMAPNPAAAGVRIAAVSPDSPAMRSGLRSGDVVLSIDGRSIAGNGVKAVDNAREQLGDLKQGQVVRLRYARQGKTFDANVKADDIHRVMVFDRDELAPEAGLPRMRDGDGQQRKRMMMLPPNVEMEIERMGPPRACPPGDDDCGFPALFQAFRWQDLNLASLDASLGRYFGADTGVLVLSSGPEMIGLQPGDVIRRVGGHQVGSPRDVMQALREKPDGSQVQLEVLRDHKPASVRITVPKSRPLPFLAPPPPPPPVPPAPPAPPHMPRAVTPAPAPPAPPVAPVPPSAWR